MRRIPGFLLLGTPLAIATAITWLASGPDSPAAQAPGRGTAGRSATAIVPYLGVSSCSAVACHGTIGRNDEAGCEQRTWASKDKHAKAHEVLFNDRSKVMVRNLYPDRVRTPKDAHPEHEVLCLKCHGPGGLKPGGPEGFQATGLFASDGVGCESCHGNAEKWLSTHYLDSWKFKTPDEKAAEGFVHTKDLVTRVTACAECHVGSADREVNHDLIAAGHPRLRFEFATYERNEPPHWKEKNYGPDFEVRAWAIGQVASARAAVKLLESRAERAQQSAHPAPWPELAEYSCYSCHHDLQPNSWRLPSPDTAKGDLARKTAGQPRWGTWYTAVLDDLAKASAPLSKGTTPQQLSALKDLRKLFADNWRASPAEAARLSKAALTELDGWFNGLEAGAEQDSRRSPLRGPTVEGLFKPFVSPMASSIEGRRNWEWDEATQRYLAVSALYRGLKDVDPGYSNPRLERALSQARQLLRFPKNADGPKPVYNPMAFENSFNAIRQAIRQKDDIR